MVDHGRSTKRKKHHDKDKYYNLAKEQGLRSRAAFKLSQINRQYPILENAKVVLDLCAAPGGWTQIAARVCGPKTQIVAVDILPIRKLHNRNIHTIVGDITTDKCKAEISRAIQPRAADTSGVDVVLHDGAPNVGASYEKDAYEQIELAVHALRCATQHLKKRGVFVTKIYRSRDSASFQWVAQQLFQEVSVFKPKASRQQSAEIFYICQGYLKPDKIDPRMLDPKHIFEHVEGDTTGASMLSGDTTKFNVFHKSWDKAKRHRGGYDTEHLDATMRHIEPLAHFVQAKGRMDAIQLLSKCTGFSFQCQGCQEQDDNNDRISCHCHLFLSHPLTTPEIKECVVDLKVLNKGDFKGLMVWRERMLQALEEQAKEENDSGDEESSVKENTKGEDGEENEEEIQREIQKLRQRKLREKKKSKKKERTLLAKKRKQAALGMDLNAIDVQEHDQFFSLATLKSAKDLDKVSEVNLDKATHEEAFGADSEEENDVDSENLPKVPARDEATGYSYRLEDELDAAYDRYLENTKDGAAKSAAKSSKRSKKLLREKLAQESHEDQELVLKSAAGMDYDTKAYAQMLQGARDDSDSNDDSSEEGDDESDDGFGAEPVTPSEHAKKRQKKDPSSTNPLIHKLPDDPKAVKTARWFSNPLFASIGQAADSATLPKSDSMEVTAPDSEEDSDDGSEDAASEKSGSRSSPSKKKLPKQQLDASDVLASMPKTDKQKRHEKRVKAMERDERRQARKAKRLGESERDFDVAPMAEEDDEDDIRHMDGLSVERKQKLLEARALIKAGMGEKAKDGAKKDDGVRFEVVQSSKDKEQPPLPALDTRKYDSDNEEYDSDDYAKTLAIGTMMMRRSKAKALVDASYNRFAWNDPQDLPEWFVDDENRHYRPQLPIPPALLAKMKEKMVALSTKPIAKVAEARARKNRKAKLKLTAAKKKAQAVVNSSEMSETMKLKQISKALRSDASKRSGKEYVVSKKGKKGVKGATMVDKRLKSDKRSMERSQKKRKSGKLGGMTGSKRRRHHS